MMKRLFAPGKDSTPTSFALLVLRVWLGATILICHGLPKLTSFDKTRAKFPELFGMSSSMGLSLAVFGEVVCALLLIMGLLTRFGALSLSCVMGVAFFIVHRHMLTGAQSGEMAFIYMAGFVAILLAGPGRYSLDAKVFGGSQSSQPSRKN